MEGIAKIGIERLLENFQSAGKSQLLTVSESSVINEKINNNMKEFKIEYKKIVWGIHLTKPTTICCGSTILGLGHV